MLKTKIFPLLLLKNYIESINLKDLNKTLEKNYYYASLNGKWSAKRSEVLNSGICN